MGTTTEWLVEAQFRWSSNKKWTNRVWRTYKGKRRGMARRLLMKVQVETDAKEIINQIREKKGIEGDDVLTDILQELVRREWSLEFNHTYREGNHCADMMAKMSLSSSQVWTMWEAPPSGILRILQEDVEGIGVPRGLRP
ncbi:uncharacterized protein LOC114746813 [Neltuma alba]|uniref:uncharacterized protein LOC114746813 n=1 Tax=Neltuma alba TaxID=207710 RepID=UPI0010A4B06F|nr:uncharacterized protein LOC114746813 [Prosopis alba]